MALSFDLGAEILKEDTIQLWVWCWFGLWEEPDFCLQVQLFCRLWLGVSLALAFLTPLPCNLLSPVTKIIVVEPSLEQDCALTLAGFSESSMLLKPFLGSKQPLEKELPTFLAEGMVIR